MFELSLEKIKSGLLGKVKGKKKQERRKAQANKEY